jgi:hypothetical protein
MFPLSLGESPTYSASDLGIFPARQFLTLLLSHRTFLFQPLTFPCITPSSPLQSPRIAPGPTTGPPRVPTNSRSVDAGKTCKHMPSPCSAQMAVECWYVLFLLISCPCR